MAGRRGGGEKGWRGGGGTGWRWNGGRGRGGGGGGGVEARCRSHTMALEVGGGVRYEGAPVAEC